MDYLSDLIREFLNLTVKAFLKVIFDCLVKVESDVQSSATQINGVINEADAATQAEINNIVQNALIESGNIIAPFKCMLDEVLPVLTSVPAQPEDEVEPEGDPSDGKFIEIF